MFIYGIINGCFGIIEVYCMGCGCMYMCVWVYIEIEKNGCEIIIVIEIFY